MVLNVDTDGFRRTGELTDLAGALLGTDFDDLSTVPPCASDPASETIMRNLNARAQWLVSHVRSGAQQASAAAAGMDATAASYDAGDSEGASLYGGGSSTAGAVPAAASNQTPTTPAPVGMPAVDPVPDVSGTEGEALALQLETGAGPGPAFSAAALMATLAARAAAANASLAAAHSELMATGESQATPGIATKLMRGVAFTEGVAAHAAALAGGYESAGNLHTLTYSQVGPSTSWTTLKTGYNESLIENAMTGGLAQPKVDAYRQALDEKEQLKEAAATGLQVGGDVVSTPPGDLMDPSLNPDGTSESESKGKESDKDKKSELEDLGSSGAQDMLQPLMGALGPLTQSLGKMNPLQSVGQLAQQLGQQAGKLGSEAAKSAALKPAALSKPLAGAGKGAGGGGKGGGSPIKPSSNLPSATHAAALGGSPSTTPPSSTPIKPAAASATSATGGGAGGMMPMGRGAGGDSKNSKVNPYETPLPEVESAGRPGVVGEAPKPASPVVNPDTQNAVKERLARRKKDAAGGDA